MISVSPGRNVGANSSRTLGQEGRSGHGAAAQVRRHQPSLRKPSTSVVLAQCPCGTAIRQRSTTGPVRAGAHLGVDPVSSTKHQPIRIQVELVLEPRLADFLHIQEVLLRGMRPSFFVCQAMTREQSRNRMSDVLTPRRGQAAFTRSGSGQASARRGRAAERERVLEEAERRSRPSAPPPPNVRAQSGAPAAGAGRARPNRSATCEHDRPCSSAATTRTTKIDRQRGGHRSFLTKGG